MSRSLGLESATFQSLGRRVWGGLGEWAISLLIWCAQISVFVGAFLMTTEIIHDLFCLDPRSALCLPRARVVLAVGALSLLVAAVPSLKAFGYISTLSMTVIFASLLLVFGQNARALAAAGTSLESKTLFVDMSQVPQSLGILLYSYEGITLYLPLRNTYRAQKSFHGFFLGTMVFIALFVFAVSVPSYYAFFDRTREIIFLNFAPAHVYLHVMKIAYLTTVFLSNPINLFPLYRSFLSTGRVAAFLRPRSKAFAACFGLLLRVLVTLACVLIAAFVSSFIKFISFVGSFFFSLLGIIVPVLLYLTHFRRRRTLSVPDALWKGLVLLVSLGLFAVASVFSFVSLIQSQ